MLGLIVRGDGNTGERDAGGARTPDPPCDGHDRTAQMFADRSRIIVRAREAHSIGEGRGNHHAAQEPGHGFGGDVQVRMWPARTPKNEIE